jgi:DNA polymerase III subunit beta
MKNANILSALKKVALKSRSIAEIDKTVLINSHSITATDLQTWLYIDTPQTWNVAGSGTLPIDILEMILRNSGQIDINFCPGSAKIYIDGTEYTAISYSADEYPIPHTEFQTIQGRLTGEAISSALDFLSKDELRPAMNGALITSGNVVGTNAHILRHFPTDYEGQDFILRKEAIQAIKAVESKSQKYCYTVKTCQKYVSLYNSSAGVMIITEKIAEPYPNWRAIMPTSAESRISVSASKLKCTLKDLKYFQNKDTNMIVLTPEANKLNISASDIDMERNMVKTLEISSTSISEGYKIGFNSKYLETICNNSDLYSLHIELNAPNRAGYINKQFLIMPMIVNQ